MFNSGQIRTTNTGNILEVIDRSMPSEKSVEIDLLMDAGGARNSRTLNSCPSSSSGANNSTARDCFSISDDESQAEDDCVVMLDQKINSNHQKINSGCVEVDITAQDSTTDDDMQAEVSDLGLQIQDVCSLSAPSQSKACNILELIDTAPCLASTVDTQPRPPPPPPPGTPCARKSADRSVVKFFEQEYSQGLESLGGKSPNWNRNGKSKNWQPVVPLEDVLKRPSLRLEAPQKTGNPPNNEEEDCVVIENDSKTQDIIVVDDQHHSNSHSTVKATYSAAENHNKHLSSNCHSLSSKALSSLKRPSSPLCEDGLCRKLPRTESADELLILDSPSSVSKVIQDNSFEPLDSRGLPDPGAGGDSEICVSPDFNREPIHVVPDAPDLNGDCDVVLPSSCVQTAGDHRKEGDKWSSPQMPASSSETTNDHVSGSSSKMQRGFSQLGAASLSSPSSGLTPAPSAGESSWIKGETCLVDYPGGLCVRGVWDGFDFLVSGSFMKKHEPAKPCKSAGVLDAQVAGQPLVVRYPNGLTIRGVWDGYYFSVAPALDTGNPMLGRLECMYVYTNATLKIH